MRRLTPPLQAIEAFIVAARSTSFRTAAEALALSPSAFSRRIQTLEAFVGAVLFDRTAHRPHLTDFGRQYFDEVEPAIRTIRDATNGLRTRHTGTSLRILSSQSFAVNWLMPRLPAFLDDHAGVAVETMLGRDLETLRLGTVDVAIANGPRDFLGLPSEPLCDLDGMVVAAPVLAGKRAPPRRIDDLHDHRLLAVETPRDIWSRWFTGVGLEGPAAERQIYFETLTLMYEAAASGLGLAIAVPIVADRYFKEGRLRPCFDVRVKLNANYNIVYAGEAVRRRPDVRAFTAWIQKETEQSRDRFAAMSVAA